MGGSLITWVGSAVVTMDTLFLYLWHSVRHCAFPFLWTQVWWTQNDWNAREATGLWLRQEAATCRKCWKRMFTAARTRREVLTVHLFVRHKVWSCLPEDVRKGRCSRHEPHHGVNIWIPLVRSRPPGLSLLTNRAESWWLSQLSVCFYL